jgi:hypothetical protein
MTTPRVRLWTSQDFTIILDAAGTAGQDFQKVLINIETALDLSHMAGYTIISSWVEGIIVAATEETGVNNNTFSYGLIVLGGAPDATDFPNVDFYEGDYFHWGKVTHQLPGVGLKPVLPEHRAGFQSRSKGQRRITDIGQTCYLVCQERAAVSIEAIGTVSLLMLMP